MKELKERILNVDFSFINYIRQETRSFSNKVIFFSSIIILISFKVIAIKELDFDGFKVDVKDYVLLALIFIVNTYFYLQFYNSIKIDILLAAIPPEISNISLDLLKRSEESRERLSKLSQKIKIATENEKFDEQTKSKLSKQMEQIDEDETQATLGHWINKSSKFIKHHKRNQNLNVYFPMVCFWISTFSICIKVALVLKEMYWV